MRTLHRSSTRLTALVFTLICVSAFTYLPQMAELLNEGRLEQVPRVNDYQYLLFRFPREVLLFGVVLTLGRAFLSKGNRDFLKAGVFRTAVLIVVWALVCVFHTLAAKDLPFEVPLLGLRILQYVPLLLAGYVVARTDPRTSLMRFADLLRWCVAVIIALGVVQTVVGPGERTIFGARSFGPFTNMNAYGATLVMCGLWFLFASVSHEMVEGERKYGPWLLACAVMALTTGSRTAITLALVVAACWFLVRHGRKVRVLGFAVTSLVATTLPLLLTSPAITGRGHVQRSNETRLELLDDVLASFETPADVVFGSGLGLYSKSVVVLFGKERFPGQVGNPHSLYLEILGGFGGVGLLGYLSCLVLTARKAPKPEAFIFLLIVGLLGVTMNLSGLFPADALLYFLWGHLLGIGERESEASLVGVSCWQ